MLVPQHHAYDETESGPVAATAERPVVGRPRPCDIDCDVFVRAVLSSSAAAAATRLV